VIVLNWLYYFTLKALLRIVYKPPPPLIFRQQQSCFSTSAALIIQICEQIILLKYSLLKRRQLCEIDLTLLMEKPVNLRYAQIDPWKACECCKNFGERKNWL